MEKTTSNLFKVFSSLALGGFILYWMYRDFDFRHVQHVLLEEMDWMWMLLSLPFGVLAQVIRGLRWRQALAPLGERVRTRVAIQAIFLSYASSLVVPRVGEFTRCAVLRRWEGVTFSRALGTVVTERALDSLLVVIMALMTFGLQYGAFSTFFHTTGTRLDQWVHQFTVAGWAVTLLCGAAALLLVVWLLRRMALYQTMQSTLSGLWAGVRSVQQVRHPWLFGLYTVGIWLCYFLHFYLTFYCFRATSHLGVVSALVTFVVGSVAVIVPTPNGAGSWHFAVKTMLILYGVTQTDALYFVLIVHSVQTLLVALLGVYAWMHLSFTSKRLSKWEKSET